MTNIRTEKKRVKTAKGRKLSSTLWLQRQLNDPYVQRAKQEGYRSRAAYKILELDEKFKFFKSGQRIVDLGAAPGGWTQVAAKRTGADKGKSPHIVSIDILPIEPIAGAEILHLDFTDDSAPEKLKALLGGEANIVLSDMAPNTSGHTPTDHLRIMALVEMAYHFACEVLAEGGTFVAKVWQGGMEGDALKDMKQRFSVVKHAKPAASRKDSAEIFVVATGFRKRP